MAKNVKQLVSQIKSSSGDKPTSKTFGQPIETSIGGKKVNLRVDAEPDAGKVQIQAGKGKNSTVDYRINTSKPVEQQIPKSLNLSKGQTNKLIKNVKKAIDWLKK